MNKKFSTLLAGVLLATTFTTNVGAQNTALTSVDEFDTNTYYLIGDGGTNGFISAQKKEVGGTDFTLLASTGLTQATWDAATDAEKQLAMWRVETVISNRQIVKVKLQNKATGAYLTLKDEVVADFGTAISGWAKDDLKINEFTWFVDADGDGKFDNLTAVEISLGTNEIKLASGDATTSLDGTGVAVQLYKIDEVNMPIADLNSKMGNGFILNAKDGSTVITSAENGLFNKQLTAITIKLDNNSGPINGSDAEEKALVNAVKKMLDNASGTDGTIATTQTASKTFFVVSNKGGKELFAKAVDGVYTIEDLDDVKEIVPLFNAATFVAVDKVKSVSAASSVAGYGYAFSNFTGAALLGANDTNKDVPVNNAWMTVKYNLNDGAAATNDNMIITVAAKFPDSDGKMTVDATVRPQISTTGDVNTLMAIPEGTDVEKWAQIGFGASSAVTIDAFKGKAFSVTVVDKKEINGAILTGYTIYPEASSWEKSSEFLANRPEGQWVVLYDKDATPNKFTMKNRETGDNVNLGDVIYLVENTTDQFYFVSQVTVNGQAVDTLKLTELSLTPARLGGYANGGKFDKVALLSTAYKLGIRNNPSDEPVFIQNSGVHNNTLSINVKTDEGLSFYLIPSIDTLAYGINKETTKYYEAIVNKNDSLRRIPYALQERVTKRFVTLDADGKYILNPTITNAEEAAQFFLKEKEDGQYVMVTKTDDKKVYVNVGTGYLHNEDDLYKKDIADEFGLYESTSPKYADILKDLKAESDTTLANINLYSVQNLVGNSAYMLASGENDFLVEGVPSTALKSMGGLAYDSVAFSIAVDTAYVNRAGNTMPLYYLAQKGAKRGEKVGPLHSGEKDQYGHPVECTHYAMNDTVVGKYLFAMYDSIVYAKDKDIKKEDYCYHYTNTEHFARLRFVDAKHIADTMIVASVKPSAKDTLKAGAVSTDIIASRQAEWLKGFEVSEEFGKAVKEHLDVAPTDDNFGLFAFEINPENEKEYAIYNPATGYYVAYLNGNVVLARQASYYTMVNGATEGMDVVANEDLNASAISVIAGNGDVTIKGAEGKKVVITNVLGQTVANTVLSSDNATIAAPQGVVVVAVEGEAAVKAIVK